MRSIAHIFLLNQSESNTPRLDACCERPVHYSQPRAVVCSPYVSHISGTVQCILRSHCNFLPRRMKSVDCKLCFFEAHLCLINRGYTGMEISRVRWHRATLDINGFRIRVLRNLFIGSGEVVLGDLLEKVGMELNLLCVEVSPVGNLYHPPL
jgi:hypothetical protein